MGYLKSGKILLLGIILLVAFFVCWPLLTSGFIPTHDGEYHLIRFYEFDKNIRAGNFFPRWASGLDFGFGAPLFNFFYPLPNYFAEIWHLLGFSFVDSFKLLMASGIFLAASFFYLWVKELFGRWPAVVGAVFYILAPYFLVDVYIRGSVGEVLALALYPAILWAVERKSWLAPIFLALLILSHNILALIFIPFLVSYLLFRRLTIHYSLFTIFTGFGLSCFFWLPALAEAKYVTGLKMINFADHFPTLFQLLMPSWGTGFSVPGIGDGMSFQVGLPHLLAIILAVFWARKTSLFRFFLLWLAVVFFLLLEVSLPLWKIIPGMVFFQYPWRLLSLVILVASATVACFISLAKQKFLLFALLFLALFFYGQYAWPVKYPSRQDNFYLENPTWTQGTATLGNSFNTIWAKTKLTKLTKRLIVNQGEAGVKESINLPTRYAFQVDVAKAAKLQVNINYFPGWQVFANNQKLKIDYEKNGLINFDLPAGEYQILIKFANTPIRSLASLISISSLFFWLGAFIFKRHAYEN